MKLLAHPDADLTADQLEKLSTIMTEKHSELVRAVESLNQELALKKDCSIKDAADAASLKESGARAVGIADQHNRTLAEINRALKKLENGRYGVSELSGDPIAYARLQLIPWARIGARDKPDGENA